jgi:PAS domain S-box-containing protein
MGETRQARLLRRVLTFLIALCLGNGVILWLPGVSPAPLFGSAFVLALAAVLAFARRLAGRWHFDAATHLTVGILLIAVGVASFIFGGIRGPDTVALVPLVLLAGLLRGRVYAAWCAALGGAIVVVLAVLEATGVGPVMPPPLGLVEATVIFLIVLTVSGVFLAFSIADIERSLRSAEAAASAALESEARITDMIEQLPDGFVAMTEEGVVTECNPSMVELLGVEREKLAGSLLVELESLTPGSRGRWLQLLAEIRSGRASGLIEIELAREDGERRVLELHTRVTRTMTGTRRVQVIARDISSRVRAAAEKAGLEAQLLESHRLESLGRLAGGVAHDFNNLLTAIVANSDMLAREMDGAERKQIEEIRQAGERAADLTQQLLAFARRQVREPRVMCVNQAIRDVVDIIRLVLPEDIEVEIDAAEDLTAIRADPAQVEQVILNLVTNARDAMRSGGRLTIRTHNVDLSETECAVHEISAGRYAAISVADTGEGMDDATRERLFEPFFTTRGQGSGLGLATVHGIVKQSGGCITVHSEPGRGARFDVFLPGVAEAPVEAPAPRAAFTPAVAGGRVLVVDDERLVRETAARLLRAAGYEVRSAESAADAIDMVDDYQPEILITDVVLPRMRGPQLAQELRAKWPELRVLFISGYAEEIIAREGAMEPGVEFLAKPFSFESLTAKVAEMLAGDKRS